ncbi:MAG TPA: OmcA/MtrC family decaheme c-type cytochrome [Bryobacteraceae bacterium]|nr:OmcA/MtrC family decaheme c-type cytochrome [Bryobacteraceae bacterium]HPT26265.1 OmcA/MtrC family decaheme c-type cytochrome [Bryobacteraceae bacterium]
MNFTPRTSFLTILLVSAMLAGALVLSSAPPPAYGVNDKAYYATEAQVNFVRPGLVFTITGVTVGTDGTVTAGVKMADPMGVPLDRDGIYTPGPISASFILANIPSGATQYVAYTTRTQTSPITGKSAVQAGTDSGGAWTKIADGEYSYKFGKKLPSGYDMNATHTVAVYGSRNLTEFDFATSYDDATFNWVPSGAAVTNTRDVIKTATCNKCHDQLGLHGGSRRTMEVCVLCHTRQTDDPDTGLSMDMVEMTHKIHMGADLPSVQAGGKYMIIGNRQSEHDYSKVVFPADARRCNVCHDQTTGAKQANAYLNASRWACGSCHDNVNFNTGENHIGLPQTSDKFCVQCHIPKGELDFDVSIYGAHLIPEESASLPGVNFKILEIHNATPGKNPLIVFAVEDDTGKPVVASKMSRLRLYLAGPTSDFSYYFYDDVAKADGNGYGVYWWTMSKPLPADATGTWAVALEGRNDVILLEGTTQQVTVRDAGKNVQRAFSVDGSDVAARRAVVDMAKCNACHANFSFHGGARNTIEHCTVCHNPTATAGSSGVTIELGTMVHKIHRGAALDRGFAIGSHNYSEIGYPGDLRNCSACHINSSEQLPLTGNQIAVKHPADLIPNPGRTTAVCTSCHDSKAVAAHAATNTDDALGEGCNACHSSTSQYSVSKSHAR